ncbi:right-handed parallel beta-helix repeat-containing protein [Thiolapillus brandeum]|uniref:Nitrous oxidase accessory protein n=1 Tax=Thiolapillus brandeum TaxID=1076588 RepID=A0A7U6JHF0_9GAMM|nr:nitrous oxide reductase family maturation protein NosD [Thiolapillus brandeum]BAO43613.1 nitrous oxidase accessory protein [Thiolapillus brandeum]
MGFLLVLLLLFLAVPSWALPPLQLYVELTPEGGTLTPPPGEYSGPVVIRKQITLDGKGKVHVDGGGSGTVITVEADQAVVKGLYIHNSGESHDKVDAGILVKANDTVIQDNIISDTLFGIHLSNAHGNRIIGNRISSRGDDVTLRGEGIRLWYSHENFIQDNLIENSRDMVISNSRENRIIGNSMRHSRISMELVFSPENEIRGNTFEDNYNGVTVIYSDELIIADNHMLDMRKITGYGISVKESYQIHITGNEIAHCAIGLLATSPLEAENILTIENNLFTFNDVATYFYGERGGHEIHHNLFIDNFVDVMGSTTNTSRLNHWEHNYWDNYSGFDLDSDGIGDQPHRVYLYADRIWMDRSMARFYRGSPALTLIDFVQRLVPSSEPDLMYADPTPLMQPPSGSVDPANTHHDE